MVQSVSGIGAQPAYTGNGVDDGASKPHGGHTIVADGVLRAPSEGNERCGQKMVDPQQLAECVKGKVDEYKKELEPVMQGLRDEVKTAMQSMEKQVGQMQQNRSPGNKTQIARSMRHAFPAIATTALVAGSLLLVAAGPFGWITGAALICGAVAYFSSVKNEQDAELANNNRFHGDSHPPHPMPAGASITRGGAAPPPGVRDDDLDDDGDGDDPTDNQVAHGDAQRTQKLVKTGSAADPAAGSGATGNKATDNTATGNSATGNTETPASPAVHQKTSSTENTGSHVGAQTATNQGAQAERTSPSAAAADPQPETSSEAKPEKVA